MDTSVPRDSAVIADSGVPTHQVVTSDSFKFSVNKRVAGVLMVALLALGSLAVASVSQTSEVSEGYDDDNSDNWFATGYGDDVVAKDEAKDEAQVEEIGMTSFVCVWGGGGASHAPHSMVMRPCIASHEISVRNCPRSLF
jgi:hypothetical protein